MGVLDVRSSLGLLLNGSVILSEGVTMKKAVHSAKPRTKANSVMLPSHSSRGKNGMEVIGFILLYIG